MKLIFSACLVAVALAACSSSSGASVLPDASISLDRNPVEVLAYVGQVEPVSLQILNGGRGGLEVTSVKLTAVDGGALPQIDAGGVFDQPLVAVDAGATSDPLPVVIGGLGTGFLQFNYAPTQPGTSTALLVIDSNDPGTPTLTAMVNACAAPQDGGGCD